MVSTTDKFGLVIESEDILNKKFITTDDILRWIRDNEDMIMYFSLIKHDKDDNEQGELVRSHYHMVVVLRKPRSCKTIINDIAKFLLINKNCISCKGVTYFVPSVQYLIHWNDKDKFQYNIDNVITSDKNDLLSTIYESTSQYEFSMDYLFKLIKESKSLEVVYRTLGIKLVRSYRSVIMDLWKEKRNLN